MKINRTANTPRIKNTASWAAALCIAAIATMTGSASGALVSVTPDNHFGDPFGGDEFLKDFHEGDLPVITDDGSTSEDGFDYRAHSDVPDLPDSDGDAEENSVFIGGSTLEPSWYPQDESLEVRLEISLAPGLVDHETPVLARPNPVPAPGSIGLLGVVGAVIAARRRR